MAAAQRSAARPRRSGGAGGRAAGSSFIARICVLAATARSDREVRRKINKLLLIPRWPGSRSRPPKPCCGQVTRQARNGRRSEAPGQPAPAGDHPVPRPVQRHCPPDRHSSPALPRSSSTRVSPATSACTRERQACPGRPWSMSLRWPRWTRRASRAESGRFQSPSPGNLGRRQARPRPRSVGSWLISTGRGRGRPRPGGAASPRWALWLCTPQVGSHRLGAMPRCRSTLGRRRSDPLRHRPLGEPPGMKHSLPVLISWGTAGRHAQRGGRPGQDDALGALPRRVPDQRRRRAAPPTPASSRPR